MTDDERAISTRCVHGKDVRTAGPVATPIAQTSTFVFEDQQQIIDSVSGVSGRHLYTRWGNPTTHQVEQKISALEGTEESIVFASGMAAITSTILGLVKSGEMILSTDSIYGGSFNLFQKLSNEMRFGIDFVDCDDFVDRIKDSNGSYKLCYFESPTNPTLKVVDIKAVAEASRSTGTISVIDSTFGTPINQQPHRMGIDVVMHSATKYLGGHSDLIAGTISASSELIKSIRKSSKLFGGTPDPFAAFLLDRGIKTLAVRVERHNENAMFLASKLSTDKRVRQVHYPGLPNHPNHDIAKSQMSGFGGMLSIDLDCGREEAMTFVDSLNLFLNAVSLGGVESLVSIPTLTSHHDISQETLSEMGISESTIRLSVGIEDANDLYADIMQALEKIF
ncbi:MAG: PLP-dependent transferase [Candidatus Thorarchaeota archaeon]|nr:MAG: PLP-dependent transferase [Candidatus Thorarchaeota archaeon]